MSCGVSISINSQKMSLAISLGCVTNFRAGPWCHFSGSLPGIHLPFLQCPASATPTSAWQQDASTANLHFTILLLPLPPAAMCRGGGAVLVSSEPRNQPAVEDCTSPFPPRPSPCAPDACQGSSSTSIIFFAPGHQSCLAPDPSILFKRPPESVNLAAANPRPPFPERPSHRNEPPNFRQPRLAFMMYPGCTYGF